MQPSTSTPSCSSEEDSETTSDVSSPATSPDSKQLMIIDFDDDKNNQDDDEEFDEGPDSNVTSKTKKVVKFRLPHEEELSKSWDGRKERMSLMTAQYWQTRDDNEKHDLDVRQFDHLVTCQVCLQLVFGRALVCRGCKLLCHPKCELQVTTGCNGEGHSPDERPQLQGERGEHTSQPSLEPKAKEAHNVKKMLGDTTDEIDVMFITERILVLTYPAGGVESAYRNSLQKISRMLATKHSHHYKVFNVSKRRHDLCKLNSQVVEFGWADDLSPPLERLCALCKDMENWLTADALNVLVVHCKGGRSRPAIVVAAYMHYTDICAHDDHSLERFAMRRFTDEYVRGVAQPSHKRYVKYFSGLLSGAIKINSNSIFLQSITVFSLPKCDGKPLETYLKVYERMSPVYTSPVYRDTDVRLRLETALAVRGDVLIKCFAWREGPGVLLFCCQFNTCALNLSGGVLVFGREELDLAFQDPRFDESTRLELRLSPDPTTPGDSSPVSSPVHDRVPRCNSYEHFETASEDDDPNMTAPFPKDVDMYASINKKRPNGSPPLANESTDSGVSSSSNHPNITQVDDELERPVISVQAKRPTLETARDQLIKVFGKLSPERETPAEKIVRSPQSREVVMETSVRTSGVKSPPATLPKPKRHAPESPYMEEKFSHRPPAVMPAGAKRPPSPSRPITPHSMEKSGIDRGLVGEDRYDPNSKAFSYVPVRALECVDAALVAIEDPLMNAFTDHFKAPKKSTQLVQRLESSDGSVMDDNIGDSWNLLDHNPHVSDRNPPVPDSPTPSMKAKARKTKYSNYKVLDLDEYNSDMDDLCDPDFYLSYTNGKPSVKPEQSSSESAPPQLVPQSPSAPPVPPPPAPGIYSPNEQTPTQPSFFESLPDARMRDSPPERRMSEVIPERRIPEPISERRVSDELESRKQARPTQPPSAWYGRSAHHDPVKSATSWDAYLDQDLYSSYTPRKNVTSAPYSRSVTSTPIHHTYSGRPPVSYDRHSLSSMGDFDADEWLEIQLEKLRMRKETHDPDTVRRKNQEKLLLDELKHIHEDRMASRGKNEADYTVEGFGTKTVDPLDEWQREQERLANTQSPYPLGSYSISTPATPVSSHRKTPLMGRQSSLDLGYHPIVTGKPPTPPPRERSRTPPSPRRMSPARRPTPPPEVPRPSSARPSHNFDHLESILWGGDEPLRRSIQQSPKSILKKPKPFMSQRYSSSSQGIDSGMRASPLQAVQSPSDQLQNREQNLGDRAETPSFPVSASGHRIETPLPYHPLLYDGAEYDPRSPGQPRTPMTKHTRPSTTPIYGTRSPSPTSQAYYGQSHRSSMTSLEPMEVIHHHPVFVKDTSKYWYKPTITREDAINILKDKPPGTFIVRDSNSFPGAFGLALKVATPPPGVQPKSNDGTELVRHFLIEPTSKGVKLKGCNNEPVFGTLSALVYQHSITPLALPCKLLLPEFDPSLNNEQLLNSTSAILEQGAACNVTYIHSCDTESLTGPEAVRRAVDQAFNLFAQRQIHPVSVHFKASGQGITVTDNTRKRFFRRHYPVVSVGFCSLDPEDRRWTAPATDGYPAGPVIQQARIFGFVARKIASRTDNACHIFAELEPEQPGTAIVNFVSKVMMGSLQ